MSIKLLHGVITLFLSPPRKRLQKEVMERNDVLVCLVCVSKHLLFADLTCLIFGFSHLDLV